MATVREFVVGGQTYTVADADARSLAAAAADMASSNTSGAINIFSGSWYDGRYVNDVTGELPTNASYHASGYISVAEETDYRISWYQSGGIAPNVRIAFYDSSRAFISGVYTDGSGVTGYTFTTPEGAAYMRFSIYIAYRTLQVEMGRITTPYKIGGNNSVDPLMATFVTTGINLVDPALAVDGEYINQVTGEPDSNALHTRTAYIRIRGGVYYAICGSNGNVGGSFRYALYNEAKKFISGELMTSGGDGVILTPRLARWMIVSAPTNAWPLQVAVSASKQSFRAYSAKIPAKYLPDSSGDGDSLRINLPKDIYATAGEELNIYFENICEQAADAVWTVTGDVGMQMERGYRITATAAQAGTYTIAFRAEVGTASVTKSTTLHIAAADAGAGSTVKVIIMGDSTTANGIVIEKLHANMDSAGLGVTTIGSRGTAPNLHEGRSGWTLNDYFTKESESYTDGRGTVLNPFYNPNTQTFDAAYYFANSGVEKPDWFLINMGINDMFNPKTDAAAESAAASALALMAEAVTSVKAAAPNAKIGVCLTIPPNHGQDAFGKAYGMSQTRNRYRKNNLYWVRQLISQFDNRQSEGIYVVPINASLDTVWNMGMETLPVNARNTDVTYQSPILNGGVHPVASGYWQIADVYAAMMRNFA